MIIIFGQVAESWSWSAGSRFGDRQQRKYSAPPWDLLYGPAPEGNDGLLRLGSLQVYEFDDTDLRNPQAWRPLLAEHIGEFRHSLSVPLFSSREGPRQARRV